MVAYIDDVGMVIGHPLPEIAPDYSAGGASAAEATESLARIFEPELANRYRRTKKKRMCYTHYRGLAQVSNWVRLKFAAMNLKKLVRWKARRLFLLPFFPFPIIFFFKFCGLPGSFQVRPLFDKLTAGSR
ncbi:MAG: hypothetical protein HFF44_06145 [Lawsonibacter sp.]|nr:hypothetical protein [Lawsonibacter sp.]